MFNETEKLAFVALIKAFALATGLSDRQLALLFNVTHPSMNRWHRMGEAKGRTSVTRWLAEPVRDKINYLNQLHERTGLYVAINRESPNVRTAALRRELDNRPV